MFLKHQWLEVENNFLTYVNKKPSLLRGLFFYMSRNIFNLIFSLSIFTLLINSEIEKIVQINGNNKTSKQAILAQINYSHNQIFSKEKINEDINDLMKMGIFDSVKIINNNNKYIINVIEKKLITYAPLVRKEDGIGWSVGPIININNIGGKGKNLYFSNSIGAFKSTEIKYFNQKILLEYTYNVYKSIESDYQMNKNKLFISYIISNSKYSMHITPQLNNYNVTYDINNVLKKYKYFSLMCDYVYTINKQNRYQMILKHNVSLNKYDDYSTLLINYKHTIKNQFPHKILYKAQLILNSNSKSPDFENLYIGGENFVRGYKPNPIENFHTYQNNLVFKNTFLQSVQLELPIKITLKQSLNTNLLFFYDYAISGDNYKNLNYKLKGYGVGLSIFKSEEIQFNLCLGINTKGYKTFHFIRNIN